MPNGHSPSADFKWPAHLDPPTAWKQHLTAMSHMEVAVNSLKRDRNELVMALEAALRWVDQLGGKALMNDKGDAREVLARIKGGG